MFFASALILNIVTNVKEVFFIFLLVFICRPSVKSVQKFGLMEVNTLHVLFPIRCEHYETYLEVYNDCTHNTLGTKIKFSAVLAEK